MRVFQRAASVLALLLLVGGCRVMAPASESPVVMGGFPIAGPADCSGDGCARFIAFATATLDDGLPGHPSVVSSQVFFPDFRGPNGEHLLVNRSGGRKLVVVLTLDGGATLSLYVGCGVGISPDICFIAEPPTP